MADLKNNWATGDTFTATDANAVATQVNAHTASITALQGAVIGPGSVTLANLVSSVQATLAKADSALQSVPANSVGSGQITDGAVAFADLSAAIQLSLSHADTALQAIANNSIGSSQIADGTVALGDLATAVQTSLGLANTALQTIAAGSVGSAQIADGSVALLDLASGIQASLGLANTALQSVPTNSVGTAQIADGTVGMVDLTTALQASIALASTALQPFTSLAPVTTAVTPTAGAITNYDARAGALTSTFPALSTLANGTIFPLKNWVPTGVLITNPVTVTCSGADTFDSGATSLSLALPGELRNVQVVTVAGTKQFSIVNGNTTIPSSDARYQRRPFDAHYRALRSPTTDIKVDVNTGDNPAATAYPWSSTKFRVCGGSLIAFSGDASLGVNAINGLNSGTANGWTPCSVEFWSDATDLRVTLLNNTNRDLWANVDDRPVSDSALILNVANGLCTVSFTQPTAIRRKWRIGIPISGLKSISTNTGAMVVPTTKNFQLAFVGASIVQGGIVLTNGTSPGVSATMSANYPAQKLAQLTGMDVWAMGHSGSGYLAQGLIADSTGPYGSTARMNALAAIPGLGAILCWTVGQNDLAVSGATVSSIVAAGQAVWSQINTAQPGVPLIVTGCYRESDALAGTTRDTLNTALRTAALAHPGVTDFIDIFNDSPFSGTGYDGSPTGSGNADMAINTDTLHPTGVGSQIFTQHLAYKKLGKIMIPVKAGS